MCVLQKVPKSFKFCLPDLAHLIWPASFGLPDLACRERQKIHHKLYPSICRLGWAHGSYLFLASSCAIRALCSLLASRSAEISDTVGWKPNQNSLIISCGSSHISNRYTASTYFFDGCITWAKSHRAAKNNKLSKMKLYLPEYSYQPKYHITCTICDWYPAYYC